MTHRAMLAVVPAMLLALAGCSSDKQVVRTYTKEGTTAEATQRSADAEAYYLSAVQRARASLGKPEQSDALFNLGSYYRKQTRFKDAVSPLFESVSLALESGTMDELDLGRRYAELARSYAALNRWQDGAAMMRNVAPLRDRYPAEEATALGELADVYKTRLTELGMDASFLP